MSVRVASTLMVGNATGSGTSAQAAPLILNPESKNMEEYNVLNCMKRIQLSFNINN